MKKILLLLFLAACCKINDKPMIRDYLKTGLPFYDALEKQARYDECYNETFKLYSPIDRFLPFAVSSDEDVMPIIKATLINVDDATETDLITDYDLDLYIDYEHVFSKHVFHYNGDALGQDLPEGQHYIKIIDSNGHIWYSEVFYICDFEPVYCSGNDELLTGWTNYEIDTFINTGRIVNTAIEAAGGTANARTNQIAALKGETYRYSGYISMVSGKWYTRLVNSGEPYRDHTTSNTFSYDVTITANANIYVMLLAINTPSGANSNGFYPSLKLLDLCTYEGLTHIKFWNDCDLDGIPFADGFVGSVYLDAHVFEPREEITRTGEDRFGEFFEESVVLHEFYKIQVLVPEYLYHCLVRLPLYDHVVLYLPNGESCTAKDVSVSGEWIEGNYLNHLTIEFRQDEVIKTSCCTTGASIESSPSALGY